MPNQPTERNLFNNDHSAGKGDKERSSKWRENYEDIDWGILNPSGFRKEGVKQVKTYGPSPAVCGLCLGSGRLVGKGYAVRGTIVRCPQCSDGGLILPAATGIPPMGCLPDDGGSPQ